MKTTIMFSIIFLFCGLFLPLCIFTKTNPLDLVFENQIKKGQLWESTESDQNNPFEPFRTLTNQVLQVKNGYVLRKIYFPDGETIVFSSKESALRYKSKLLGTNFIERNISGTNLVPIGFVTLTQITSKVFLEVKE